MRIALLIAVVTLCADCATKSSAPGRTGAPDAQVAADYETGKRAYTLHCSRCHGRDGKDDTYPFIARLDGIGTRMSLDEILEATWASGFVSRQSLTEEEQRGLAVYVATL